MEKKQLFSTNSSPKIYIIDFFRIYYGKKFLIIFSFFLITNCAHGLAGGSK